MLGKPACQASGFLGFQLDNHIQPIAFERDRRLSYRDCSMNNSTQTASHLLRSRIGNLCVVIIGTSPNEMIEKATEVLKESSFLEFRLDYLAKPLAALAALKHFLAENGAATAIATCR